jgi:WD40 repeat protein
VEISGWNEVAHVQQNGSVMAIAFSPDGRYFASGSYDDTARVIKVNNGQEVMYLQHDGPVTAIAFSPDGLYIATGSGDGTARVIEVRSGQEVARLQHDDEVSAIAFSPDGRTFATGSWDGTAQLILYRHDDMIAHSCNKLQRNLSLDEWNRFVGKEIPYHVTCPGKYVPRDAQEELNAIQNRRNQIIFGSIGGLAILIMGFVTFQRWMNRK